MEIIGIDEQRDIFNGIRDDIDRELRNTGFEEFFSERNIDTSMGRLVVGREFVYSSQAASLFIDRDPEATLLEVEYVVGPSIETPTSRSFNGIVVSSGLIGEGQEPYPDSESPAKLDYIQLAVVECCMERLIKARAKLPYITESLRKVHLYGD